MIDARKLDNFLLSETVVGRGNLRISKTLARRYMPPSAKLQLKNFEDRKVNIIGCHLHINADEQHAFWQQPL